MKRYNRNIRITSVFFVVFLALSSSCALYEDNEFSTFQGKLMFDEITPASNIDILFSDKLHIRSSDISVDLDTLKGIYKSRTSLEGNFRFVVPKKNRYFPFGDQGLYFLYIDSKYYFELERLGEKIDVLYLDLNEHISANGDLDLSEIFVKSR